MLESDLKEAKEGLRDSSQRQTALHRKYENLSQRTIQLQEDYNETKLQLQETLVSLFVSSVLRCDVTSHNVTSHNFI